MLKLVLSIYDFLKTHKVLGVTCFVVLTSLLAILLSRQNYKEDISDFLPVDGNYQKAMDTYQRIAGGDRLFVLVQKTDTAEADPDLLVDGVCRFEELLAENDTSGIAQNVTATANLDQFAELSDSIYAVMPLLLSDADYDSIEARLSEPDCVPARMSQAKQQLMLPISGVLSAGISKDPVGLFHSVVERLLGRSSDLNYELYDGCLFTPDMKHALVMVESPFGSSETENNGRLLQLLEKTAKQTTSDYPQIAVHITGGPSIAVDNANQIKHDSLITIALAVVLILFLLLKTIRSWRNILLIVLAVGWGWLFAMGVLSVVHHNVSIIVVGISSLIIGIAVNYPLHLIAHLGHCPDRRGALKEIMTPLVVGNVTTVGAFLALLPLKSVALKDLGAFAALLLVGTILFVLLLLPHLAKVEKKKQKHGLLFRVGNFSLESRPWIAVVVTAVTVVMLFFCFRTRFDANLNHINYMTDEQKSYMASLSTIVSQPDSVHTVYAVSMGNSLEQALEKSEKLNALLQNRPEVLEVSGCHGFLSTQKELNHRLDKWREFISKHGERLKREVRQSAQKEGFSEDSFNDFYSLLGQPWHQVDPSELTFLKNGLFKGNVIEDSKSQDFRVVDVVKTRSEKSQELEMLLEAEMGENFVAFDAQRLNSTVATNLSDNFNYIGWACGLIVFFFLWFSFESLELALLSFLPMAVSWVWILGLMSLLGIQFNVVNVILATFIFGQGDDYTIFMTEGCQYEYAYRRKMLSSYKSSIILSALIMFIGIGTLIIAKHPALRSLAQITILGMFSVVLMAYLFPPLIFQWLVKKNGKYRLRPLSVCLLWHRLTGKDKVLGAKPTAAECRQLVLDRYRYKGPEVIGTVRRNLRRNNCYARWVDACYECDEALVLNSGYGEFALLFAIVHPHVKVLALEPDSDKTLVARYSAEGIADNLATSELTEDVVSGFLKKEKCQLFLIRPDDTLKQKYNNLNPVIIT